MCVCVCHEHYTASCHSHSLKVSDADVEATKAKNKSLVSHRNGFECLRYLRQKPLGTTSGKSVYN